MVTDRQKKYLKKYAREQDLNGKTIKTLTVVEAAKIISKIEERRNAEYDPDTMPATKKQVEFLIKFSKLPENTINDLTVTEASSYIGEIISTFKNHSRYKEIEEFGMDGIFN